MHILNHTFFPSLSNPPDTPIVNIADAFQFQAFYHPTSLAVCVPGSHYGPVSYGRLLAMSNSIGWRCLAASVKAGHVVAILSSDPVFHLATILALKRIGAVSLSIGQALLPDEFAIDVVITDTAQKFAGCEQVLIADWSWTVGDDRPLPRHDVYGGYESAADAHRIDVSDDRRSQGYCADAGDDGQANSGLRWHFRRCCADLRAHLSGYRADHELGLFVGHEDFGPRRRRILSRHGPCGNVAGFRSVSGPVHDRLAGQRRRVRRLL